MLDPGTASRHMRIALSTNNGTQLSFLEEVHYVGLMSSPYFFGAFGGSNTATCVLTCRS